MPRPGDRIVRRFAFSAGILLLATTGMLLQDRPTIFLVGDSTMAEKPLVGNPERGWGMAFALFVDDAAASVENHARGGRSTKSFLREGRWDSVARKIAPGDYVLIQFGHNDEKFADTNRYAAAQTTYRELLTRFVRETRGRGGVPLLLTPVTRRKFVAREQVETHAEYSAVMKEVGAAEGVPVLDVDSLSRALLSRSGEEASKGLYLWLRPGVLSRLDTGKTDNTHFSSRGAYAIASLVVDEIRRQSLPLARYLRTTAPPEPVASEKTVLLDCYFNNEWRTNDAGKRERFHYVWDDTTNSGFSILARRIVDAGAAIDTLCQAPTRALLARASVYLIVDPDTPKENPAPHLIDTRSADEISAWVRDGGVLVLLGNDSGNAEFAQWNRLAERFGIHFTEESRNRVAGREYAAGTFDRLPGHPLFRGVGPIFLKEISTLALTAPAEPLLVAEGKTIMAVSRFGRGLVFAVGDPWLYNEYMDARRLPAHYGNAKAGENLFRWLCGEARPVAWSAAGQDDPALRMQNLPFPAPAVRIPNFPDRTVEITAHGAVGDGQTLNTDPFARAIDACAKAGGGTVLVPRGLWLTGAIRLQSNIRLHLERGAVILFSRRFEDFPLIAGFDGNARRYRCVPQLSAYRAENIAITGPGMINGQGDAWRPVKKEKLNAGQWKALVASGGAVTPDGKMWYPSREAMEGEALLETLDAKKGNTREEFARAREFLRPVMVQFVDCRAILIDGPTFVNAPAFHLQPVQSENIIIRNVTVRTEWWAQNGDGIDLSACREVLIAGCTLDVGDDALCIKPGTIGKRQAPGPACANIVITDCTVFHGHGGFVIGSESYGGARNIAVRNCTFQGTDVGLRFKSSRGRGGVIEKIYVDGVTMSGIGREAILFDMFYDASPGVASGGSNRREGADQRVPEFRDFTFRRIEGSGAETAIAVTGLEEMPVRNLLFEDVTISAKRGLVCVDAEGIVLRNVRLIPESGPMGDLTRSRDITFERCPIPAGAGPVLRVEGATSGAIRCVGMDFSGKPEPVARGAGVGPDAVSIQK